MSKIGKAERATQNRVIKLFTDSLGYRYLGDKTDQTNSNIETAQLTAWLHKQGYDQSQINRALDLIQREAQNPNRSLYDNNKAFYEQLRYGVKVKTEAGQATETVWLINWDDPLANDFAIAEEVTLKGNAERRPDLVLYINGIAIGVIELKRSAVSIGQPRPNKSKTETYEDTAKELFIKQPANMRLLIVVDKLLTGFDAPSCTYLYIDKSMQDHGLFQAICRTNRLDGDDKQFGYIVDYKDLFNKVQGAIAVYTKELDDAVEGEKAAINLKDRLKQGRETLEAAREALGYLCDPVHPPKSELDFIHYFCGNVEIPQELAETEPLRVALYKAVAILVRSFAAIADCLAEAGYTAGEAAIVKAEVERAVALRETIRHASGETIDLKAYEADMRYLLDTYIKADEAQKISDFDNVGLLDLIVKSGIADAINSLPKGIKSDRGAVAETIANNIRSKILQNKINDPAFYDKMSDVLDGIIADIKARRISYEEFLEQIAELAKKVQAGQSNETPPTLDTPAKRALYNNLGNNLDLALAIDAEGRCCATHA